MKGMGGAATAFIDPFTVNNFNPASYSYLKVTTLDFAFEGRSRNITLGDQQSSSGTATFSHLTLGVPLGKYGGMGFGLQPESSIYYNAHDTQNVAGIGRGIYKYNGSGTGQYAYLGLAGAYKGFSLGAHLGYLFGNSRYNNVLQNIDTTQAYNAEFGRSHSIGGIYWKAGMMYQAKFKQDHYLNLGLTATLSQDIRTTSSS